jgi:Sulfotransferase family
VTLADPQPHSESAPLHVPRKDPLKVVYITGAGRSGTTLLDILLGELDGFFSAGEMRWLWWGYLNNWRCGCNLPLKECPVWTSILTRVYGTPPTDELVRRTMKQQQTAVRLHYLPRILAKRAGHPTGWPDLDVCIDTASKLYRSIAEETGSRVIVDSSKNAPEAGLLRLVPGLETYVLQLTRDPRAVANSQKRKVKMEPGADTTFEQPVHNSVISALIWARKNAASDITRMRFTSRRARLVRYEDLVSKPQETLHSIADFVGEPWAGLSFSGERTVHLSGNHTSWGNPSRFRTGDIELRLDNEWVRKLGFVDRAVPTTLSLPLLLRYKYPLRRSSVTS